MTGQGPSELGADIGALIPGLITGVDTFHCLSQFSVKVQPRKSVAALWVFFGGEGVQEPWVSIPELHAHHPISKHFPTELYPWPWMFYSETDMQG